MYQRFLNAKKFGICVITDDPRQIDSKLRKVAEFCKVSADGTREELLARINKAVNGKGYNVRVDSDGSLSVRFVEKNA